MIPFDYCDLNPSWGSLSTKKREQEERGMGKNDASCYLNPVPFLHVHSHF
ncbi:hypothetical protein RB4828 [Rhodopirellula baltica SH 1]|uniref:Uncharacterized protein n=1 Tax=Rhodopirellula baltica (strain DSM 10527 / NCIMB 13988 / SH1) TaxID=243090 RepID=Q7UH57_RHOBA|nr:hypothetical protein RB4828 [Rhodopirellula baltica SH 1]